MRDDDGWTCQYCGASGRLPARTVLDEMQCPDCGEPVHPA